MGSSQPPPPAALPPQCLSSAHFLPHIGTGEESVHTYQQMVQAMDELVRKTFQDWTATLDKDCIRRLDTPLLRVSQEKAGMLDVNFDKYETRRPPFPALRPAPVSPLPLPPLSSLRSCFQPALVLWCVYHHFLTSVLQFVSRGTPAPRNPPGPALQVSGH